MPSPSAGRNPLVTTEALAHERQAELDALVETWFRTIRYVEADLPANSTHICDYLRAKASTVYSVEEYQIAWSFNVFPKGGGASTPPLAQRFVP